MMIIMADKKCRKLKQNIAKKFKDEPNVDEESKQEQGANLKQVFLELFTISLRENSIYAAKPNKSKSYEVFIELVPARDCDAPPSIKIKSAVMAKECGMQPGAGDMSFIYLCNDDSAITHNENITKYR